MYAHQVIEDLKNGIKNNSNIIDRIKYVKKCEKFINLIQDSIKFNVESPDKLMGLFERFNGKIIFDKEFDTYLKLPFETIWIDYEFNVCNEFLNNGEVAISKRAILVQEVFSKIIQVFVFNYAWWKKQWVIPLMGQLFSLGSSFQDNKDFNSFIEDIGGLPTENWVKGNTIQFPIDVNVLNMDSNKLRYFLLRSSKDNQEDYSLLNAMILSLNCKNISTEKNHPPEALNKKRQKQGKQPLFTYHTLVVNPVAEKKNDTTDNIKTLG